MKRIVLNTTSSGLEEMNVPHEVEFIRFNIHINNVHFIDGVNINAERLNRIMLDNPASPSSTTPASVEEILAMFGDLEKRGFTDIFVVTIASAISESYANITTAKSLFGGKLNIFIYDTKAVTFIEAALAFEADQLVKQGKSFEEVAWRLDQIRQNSTAYITVSRLDYLIANKKIAAPAGFFANLFDIKPVIELSQSGELVAIKNIRKIEKSLEYIAEHFFELRNQGAFIYAISCGDTQLTAYFVNLLRERHGIRDLPILPGASISTANHGPNMVGMGAFFGERPLIFKHLC